MKTRNTRSIKWEFYRRSKTKFDIHSPFIYQFYKNVLQTPDRHVINAIEAERKKLLKDNRIIAQLPIGAGSKRNALKNDIRVRDIAEASLSTGKDCRALHQIITFLNAKNVIELGTSLGISTAYMAKGNPKTIITTIEGNPHVSIIAREVFDLLKLSNIHSVTGLFDEVLEDVLKDLPKIDLAYLDGNHLYASTLKYFDIILNKIHDQSGVIIDDIFWSEEMYRAWVDIQNHDAVTCTIETMTKGYVFFDPVFVLKTHFAYIPYQYKPWRIGAW